MNLGKKIFELRKKSGLSQEQLGEKINVTRQTISNWELGETSPNPEQLKALSKELNISIDELLDNDIKSILVEKVSNTEKLAGLVLKVLKYLGITFVVFLIIDITAFIIFLFMRSISVKENNEVIICQIEDKEYEIEYGTGKHFECKNCSKEMNKELEKIINFYDIGKSSKNIENYFKNNNGICK